MRESVTNKLYELAPILYQDKDKPETESLMCYGFDCWDGWYPILLELTVQLEVINWSSPVTVKAFQVKQKFGELRFYVDIEGKEGASQEEVKDWSKTVHELIAEAERLSQVTCEICGNKEGRMCGRGYIRTLCEYCEEARYNAAPKTLQEGK